MNRQDLKHKLDEMGIDENYYSLSGNLEWDKIILYENYSNWEVFYLSERGTRDNLHVFHSEDEACQYIHQEFQKLQNIQKATEKVSDSKELAIELLKENGYIESLSNTDDKVLFSDICNWSFLPFLGQCVEIKRVESKEELFSQLAKKLCIPNFKNNWDDLMVQFQDFHWIDNANIYIIHHDLGCLPLQILYHYYEIIINTIRFWKEKKQHKVYFVFSKEEKQKFQSILDPGYRH